MASYDSSALIKLLSGATDSFRKDVLDEATYKNLRDELYKDESDNSRLTLLARMVEPEKDRLLALARVAQGTVAAPGHTVSYL